MEQDFPFAFGATSDQDDNGDDGLFCVSKEKKKAAAKARALLNQEPYRAQIDKDGWFHSTGKSTFELMTQSKSGATKVKMRADHYYMLHRYQEAFDIAQEYCEIVRSIGLSVSQGQNDGGLRRPGERTADNGLLKVTDPKEMQEMAMRCALKLNRFDIAVRFADELVMHDTGIVFLKAKAYVAVGRFNDAALGLVQYQKSRTGNYSIWRTLGECLQQSTLPSELSVPLASTPTSPSTSTITATDSLPPLHTLLSSLSSKPTIVHILALMCILRSRHLMRISTWAQVPYAQARYDNEMNILDDQRLVLERICGLDFRIIDGEQTEGTAGKSLEELVAQRRLEEYEQKIVVPARKFISNIKESEMTHTTSDNTLFALEVMEFIVKSWDAQVVVLTGSTSGIAVDDEDLAGEVSVRNK
ncbi:hypothetical protein FBU30_002552 [Linnemannia zychae]|nr:hypothetical protein FBU30_002552 [Linnemannia zychae]